MTSAPRSASIMPAHGPVMNVPCSMMRMPLKTPPMRNELGALLMAGAKARGRLAVVIDGRRRGMRQDEADGPQLLFEQVCNQPGGSRQYGDTLERAQRVARIQEYGRDRARHVQGQRLADQFGNQGLDLPRDADMPAHGADLRRDVEQAAHPGVEALVQGMTVSRYGAAAAAIRQDDISRRAFVRRARVDPRGDLGIEFTGGLR